MKKSEEKKQQIYETALELFQQKGFVETTMRDIAKKAGVALGATYYYFDSKELIILDFYRGLQTEMEDEMAEKKFRAGGFKQGLRDIIDEKIAQMNKHRTLLKIIFRSANDPDNPLSPFSEQTKDTRDRAIALFEKLIAESKVEVPDDLKSHLPRLLWFYQMGIILFWFYDKSENQKVTTKLTEKSLELILFLIKMSNVPFIGAFREKILEFFTLFEEKQISGKNKS